jgi:hypothetical protein
MKYHYHCLWISCKRASGSLVELADGSLPARVRYHGIAQRPLLQRSGVGEKSSVLEKNCGSPADNSRKMVIITFHYISLQVFWVYFVLILLLFQSMSLRSGVLLLLIISQ